MSIIETNLSALCRLWKKAAIEKYEAAATKAIEHCTVIEAAKEENIICRLQDNREWRLNSIYDPEMASALYAERYGKIKDFAVLCIYGLSDGRTIRHLLRNCNETQTILIYEPDYEIFLTAMEQLPLEDIFLREHLYLIVHGINEDTMPGILEDIITYQNHLLIENMVLPNYDVLYYDLAEEFIKTLLYYSRLEVFKKNTDIDYGKRLADNLLYNLPYMLCHSSVAELKEQIKKHHIAEAPAIIVSAGPSLDKNIKDLKRAEGKAFMIGVDSALKALVREGISFQIAVSVDPRKNPEVFSDERVNQYPYLVAGYALPLIAEKNKSRLFFEGSYGFEPFAEMILKNTGKMMETVRTGGSVATDAFSLAVDLGFRNIIMVGQDLAFTDGRGHVSGFEKSEEADKKHVEDSMTTEVDAFGGGRIRTDIQMESYKRWFELRIQELKDEVTVYNATEGGARIYGTIETTLSDALEKLCSQGPPRDFDQMLAEAPKMLSGEEKGRMAGIFLNSIDKMDEIEEKLRDGIAAYERLMRLEETGGQNSPEYKKVIQRIYEVNHIEKTERYMHLVKLYAKAAEYEATEDIYEADALSVREIAERGKQLLEGYIDGVHVCKQRLESILAPGLQEIIK